MTTAEAAQKWAEAKEARERASEALKIAQDAYKAADAADLEAWKVLSELSGRVAGAADFALANQALIRQGNAQGGLVPKDRAPRDYGFDDGFLR